jgi:hypothetical protein
VVIVLHSSKSADELAELARRSGARGFITKTSDTMRFLAEFHRIVFGEVVSFPFARALNHKSGSHG